MGVPVSLPKGRRALCPVGQVPAVLSAGGIVHETAHKGLVGSCSARHA